MQTQACQPCAKRKVRCDRREPCSNCTRRKQDRCIYAELAPAERIKQLEALVRSLGGGTEADSKDQGDRSQANTKPVLPSSRLQRPRLDAKDDVRPSCGTNPMIVNEDGESIYLESWDGKTFETVTALQSNNGYPRTPTLFSTGSSALQSIICGEPYIDVTKKHPTVQDASTLWDTYFRRVHPILRSTFTCELERLRDTATALNGPETLTFQQHAFTFALYLVSVSMLSDDECLKLLKQPKAMLVPEFRTLCEQALAGSNFFVASDLTTIQASAMYILAGMECLDTKSLWSLMGVVLRNAEKCGLHRDGTLLGLPPYETEVRRRTWWQLQNLDIALAVKSGSISLTSNAPWDTKLPLNIQDEDIDSHMKEAPKERQGLTDMSHCLWTYWVVQKQRSFCRVDGSRLGFSWAADRSLSMADKDALIDSLEVGLNERYLKFCDPIRPRDMLIHILARSFICCMRRLTLHPLAQHSTLSGLGAGHRNRLLDVCMQALEYDVAMNLNPSIKLFRSYFQAHFQWSALICVLVEARRQFDTSQADRIWELLSEVYTANPSLSELQRDRRKSHAVELIMLAWRARENVLLERHQRQPERHGLPEKPDFLVALESKLVQYNASVNAQVPSKRKLDETATCDATPSKKPVPTAGIQGRDVRSDDTNLSHFDFDTIADMNFDAIDWSFWDAVPTLGECLRPAPLRGT